MSALQTLSGALAPRSAFVPNQTYWLMLMTVFSISANHNLDAAQADASLEHRSRGKRMNEEGEKEAKERDVSGGSSRRKPQSYV